MLNNVLDILYDVAFNPSLLQTRIQKEKKQLYVKHKVIENSMINDTLVERGADGGKTGGAAYVDLDNDYMSDFVESYEESMRKKKEKANGE